MVQVFTRMLDNVVEINGLPLGPQRDEIFRKRRHGMGFLGLGSTITMLRMNYGNKASVAFTQDVARELALAGWETALELAREKGPAPIMEEEFDGHRGDAAQASGDAPRRLARRRPASRARCCMPATAATCSAWPNVNPELVDELAEVGARFTHHSSIAPTGTISLSLANNASNGIEPSFAHHYFRNVIREGRKTKEKVDVFSFELLAYRTLVNERRHAGLGQGRGRSCRTTSSPRTTSRRASTWTSRRRRRCGWTPPSPRPPTSPRTIRTRTSRTSTLYAHEQGLKGCTTFRFNPEAFQGVLVKEKDLKNTTYVFELEDGSTVEVKGDEEVEYDGETPHRGEPVRRSQRRLLREVLSRIPWLQ